MSNSIAVPGTVVGSTTFYPVIYTPTEAEREISRKVADDPGCAGSGCPTARVVGAHGWVECSLLPAHDGDCVLT